METISTSYSEISGFSYCLIVGLKSALVGANSEIHRLKKAVWETYRKFAKEESASMTRKIEFERKEENLQKNITELQTRVSELEIELKDKENENVNLNFKVKELKAFVEEKIKEVDALRDKSNKVQKPASKEAYRTKYRSLRRHLKTIIKNVQNKPDSKVLQDISNLLQCDEEKDVNLEDYVPSGDSSDKISIQITLPDLLSLNTSNYFNPPADVNQCNTSNFVKTVSLTNNDSDSKEKLPDLVQDNEDLLTPVAKNSEQCNNFSTKSEEFGRKLDSVSANIVEKDVNFSNSNNITGVIFEEHDKNNILPSLMPKIDPISPTDTIQIINNSIISKPTIVDKSEAELEKQKHSPPISIRNTSESTDHMKLLMKDENISLFEPFVNQDQSEEINLNSNSLIFSDKFNLCNKPVLNNTSTSIFEPPENIDRSESILTKVNSRECDNVTISSEAKILVSKCNTFETEDLGNGKLKVSIENILSEMIISQKVKKEMESFQNYFLSEVTDESIKTIENDHSSRPVNIQNIPEPLDIEFTPKIIKMDSSVKITDQILQNFEQVNKNSTFNEVNNHHPIHVFSYGNKTKQKLENSSLQIHTSDYKLENSVTLTTVTDSKSQDLLHSTFAVPIPYDECGNTSVSRIVKQKSKNPLLKSSVNVIKNVNLNNSTFLPIQEKESQNLSQSLLSPVSKLNGVSNSKNLSPKLSQNDEVSQIVRSTRDSLLHEKVFTVPRDELKMNALSSCHENKATKVVYPDVFEIINELTYLHRTALESEKTFAEFANEDEYLENRTEENNVSGESDTEYIVIAEILPETHERTNIAEIVPETHKSTNIDEILPETHASTNIAENLPETHKCTNISEILPKAQESSNIAEISPETHKCTNIAEILPEAHESSNIAEISPETHKCTNIAEILPEAHESTNIIEILPGAHEYTNITEISPEAYECTNIAEITPEAYECTSIAEILPEAHKCINISEVQLDNHVISKNVVDLKITNMEPMDLDQPDTYSETSKEIINRPVFDHDSVPTSQLVSPVNGIDEDIQSDVEEEDKLVIDEGGIIVNNNDGTGLIRSDVSTKSSCDVSSVLRCNESQNCGINADCRSDNNEGIVIKNDKITMPSRYNLRHKTVPNFVQLSKSSPEKRKGNDDWESCLDQSTSSVTAGSCEKNESDTPRLEISQNKEEADVDKKSSIELLPNELCNDMGDRTFPKDLKNDVDTKSNQQPCLPKFYRENAPDAEKPIVACVSLVDEVWSTLKYLDFEIPELKEEDYLVQCRKPVTHMAFYSKKEKHETTKVVVENIVRFDMVKKSLENFLREKNKSIAFANLTACISQSNKTTVSCAIAALITSNVDREVLQDVKIIHELRDLCFAIDKGFNGFLDSMKSYLRSQMFAKIFSIDENSGGLSMISCTILWSKFYTVLSARCKTNQDVEDVLNLVYDSLDLLKNRAHPIAYGVLTEWPEIFSYENPRSKLLIPIMLFSLVHHKMTYNVQMYKTVDVQKILGQLYGVRLGHKTAEQYAKEAMLKVDDPFWVNAVVLLCKRQMFPWTYTNIVMKYILPILRKWEIEDFSESLMYKFIQALQKIMLACPYNVPQSTVYNLDAIINTLSTILSSKKGSRKLKEIVAIALCELSTWKFSICSNLLSSWIPPDGLISSKTLQKMKEKMHERRHRTEWIAFFAPVSTTRSNENKPCTRSNAKFKKPDGKVIPVGVPCKMRTLNNPIKKKKTNKKKRKKTR